jgi:indole-3-acetate monooxygenase
MRTRIAAIQTFEKLRDGYRCLLKGMAFSGTIQSDEQTGSKTVLGRLLSEIRELEPQIADRSAEMDSTGRIPVDLVESLKTIGVFRMFVPRSHGGFELDFIDGMKVIQALSRIDGSIGWTVMISIGIGIFATSQHPDIYDKMYADGPDLIFAGSIKAKGNAEATANGWRLAGRWGFATACQHADWMYGGFVMCKDGVSLLRPDGQTVSRFCFLPAKDWQIHDNWHVAGLKATGSHDIEIKNGLATEKQLFDLFDPEFRKPGPLYYDSFPLILLLIPATFVGIAEGTVDEVVRVANSGRQQSMVATPMRESEWFQAQLGRIEANLNAARDHLQVRAAEHWSHALKGKMKMEPFLTQTTQTSAWLGTTCVRIANECFALAGSAAVYETSPLQRRLRDLLVAAQHGCSQKRQYVASGKLLLDRSGAPDLSSISFPG